MDFLTCLLSERRLSFVDQSDLLEKHVAECEAKMCIRDRLDVSDSVKEELRRLSPQTYTGICTY